MFVDGVVTSFSFFNQQNVISLDAVVAPVGRLAKWIVGLKMAGLKGTVLSGPRYIGAIFSQNRFFGWNKSQSKFEGTLKSESGIDGEILSQSTVNGEDNDL